MNTLPPASLRPGLSQVEAAELLGVTRRTLNNWERARYGPQPIRDNGRLLYDPSALEAFKVGAVA